MKALPLIAISAASLLGITACSSDRKLTAPVVPKTVNTDTVSSSDVSVPDVNLPSNISIPDVGIPANIPGLGTDCLAYVQAFASAFAGDKTSLSGIAGAFDKLSNVVPPELKGDVKTLSEGFAKLTTLYAKYNYDYTKIATDPDVQTLVGDKKFTDASDHVTNWLATQCNLGS